MRFELIVLLLRVIPHRENSPAVAIRTNVFQRDLIVAILISLISFYSKYFFSLYKQTYRSLNATAYFRFYIYDFNICNFYIFDFCIFNFCIFDIYISVFLIYLFSVFIPLLFYL